MSFGATNWSDYSNKYLRYSYKAGAPDLFSVLLTILGKSRFFLELIFGIFGIFGIFWDFLGLDFSLSTSKVQAAVTLQIGYAKAYYLRAIPVKYERQMSFQLRV